MTGTKLVTLLILLLIIVKDVQSQEIDCCDYRTCNGGRKFICRCPNRGSLGNPDSRLPLPGFAPPPGLGTTTPQQDVLGSGGSPAEEPSFPGTTGINALNARPVMCASIPCCDCDYAPGFLPRGLRK